MRFDREKFKTLVHYICWRCRVDPSKLGSVKLNKVLWLSDFTAYYNKGQSMTGARYIKRQYGPVPSAIQPAIRELERDGVLNASDSQFHGFQKKEFEVHVDPDQSLFEAGEIEIIEAAIQFVCYQNTAKSISELSHDHIWQAAQEGEELPYFTVFSIPGTIDDDEREWAKIALETLS